MLPIDSLINDDAEAFRKHIQDSLYNKIKEKIQDKKSEIAMSLYDEEDDEHEDRPE
jgi:hypothetical protein